MQLARIRARNGIVLPEETVEIERERERELCFSNLLSSLPGHFQLIASLGVSRYKLISKNISSYVRRTNTQETNKL